MFKNLFILLICVLAIGCNSKDKENVSNGAIVINVDFSSPQDGEALYTSNIVSSIDCIEIEASEEPIGIISDIKYNDGKYYLLDKSRQAIHIVDSVGHIINTINRRGRANYEYITLQNMDVNPSNGEISVYDPYSRKVVVYDISGKLVRVVDSEDIGVARDFAVLKNGDYLFYKPDNVSDARSGLWQTDSNGHFKKQLIEIDPEFQYGGVYPKYFTRINDDVVGLKGGEDYDRIYHISCDSINVKYQLKFNITIPKALQESRLIEYEQYKGHIYTKRDYYETNEWMYIAVSDFQKGVRIFYDKTNNKCHQIKDNSYLIEDLVIYGGFSASGENRLMSVLDVATILNYDSLKERFPNITEDSNPIITVSHTK